MQYFYALSLALLIVRAQSFPVDDPIRVDLPVYDIPSPQIIFEAAPEHVFGATPDFVAEGYAPSAQIEARTNVGIANKGSIVGNIISQKLHKASGVVSNVVSHKISNVASQKAALLGPSIYSKTGGIAAGGIFGPPISKLESAVVESESVGSKAKTIKENIQHIVAGIFQPKPIVDTISEHEKYGNNGDKFYNVGRAFVGGAEGVSNLVNSALEVPGAIFKKITRTASEKLNNLGGKLIGL